MSSYFYGDQRRSIFNLLRELKSVSYIVCPGELEASITELRLIHHHLPRYNRASKPAKANHFVTLTSEEFPRLSLTRTIHEDSSFVLGPFRSRKTAELVMHAIWDATRIRRCTGKPGRRSGRCAMAQLGVAMCPCDGSLTPDEYAPELTPLTEAISGRPHALLDPLVDRMRQQMIELRYEEAAWTRDRYRALVRALQRRRQWTELQEAGRLEAVTAGGEQAEILMGHFLRSWKTKDGRPLSAVGDPEPPTCVPSTVGVAEEARLIWRWLERPDTEIIECSGATPEPSVSIGMVNAL